MPIPDFERYARRLVPAGWLTAVVGLVWGGAVGLPVAAAGIVLLLLACVSRRDGFLLFGPVAARELGLTARLRRPWVWRVLYTAAATGVIYLYLDGFTDLTVGPWAARVNGWMAQTVAGGLFLFAGLLAVMEYAAAVPDDRAAKRWEVLRASDLRPREIVFGKWLGRLPVVLQPAFAVAPVLFAQAVLFGGVSPWFPPAVLACCAAVALSLGGMALHFSVASVRGRAAGRTFAAVFAYLLAGLLLGCPRVAGPWLSGLDAVAVLNAGNPLVILVTDGLPLDMPDAVAEKVLDRFIAFHAVVGLTFLLLAVRRVGRTAPELRSARRRQNSTGRQPVPQKSGPPRRGRPPAGITRPPLRSMPIVWWERYGPLGRLRAALARRWSRQRVLLYTALLHLPFWLLLWDVRDHRRMTDELWEWYGNLALGVLVAGGVLFGVPPYFRAARCMARERAADTLEPLLLTALSPAEIAFQKWLGVLLRGWPVLMPAVAFVGFAVAHRALPAGGVGMIVGGVLAMAGGLAAVGLAISARVKSPRRAVGLAVGLITLAVCVANLHLVYDDDANAFELLSRLCPPVAAAPHFADPAARPGGFLPLDPSPRHLLRLWAEGVGIWVGVGGLAFVTAWQKLRGERAT